MIKNTMANPPVYKTLQHVLDDDVIRATEDRRPSSPRDQKNAKVILQECSTDSGDCVFDHISDIIKRIIDERPPNVIDYFEDFSRQVKEERFRIKDHSFQETYMEPPRLHAAKNHLTCLKIPPPEDYPGAQPVPEGFGGDEEDSIVEPLITDVMHLQFFWSLAGVGFPRNKAFLLSCAIRKLEQNPIVDNVRFWGVIYGIKKDYYIVEVDLTDEENERRLEIEENEFEKVRESWAVEKQQRKLQAENVPEELIPKPPPDPNDPDAPPKLRRKRPPPPKMPRSYYFPPKEIPPELSGTGVNRRTYFVSNHIGEKWVELPAVSPKHIVKARQIRKFFTGDLEADIHSYPKYPGKEKHLLRAQIARITHTTYISPVGYHMIGFGDDEEEEMDEEGDNNDKVCTVDPGYEPLPYSDLLEPSFWAHYRPYILKQGRINWFDPRDLEDTGEEEQEAEDEEEGEGEDMVEPETGPSLLTPCTEDTTNEKIPPWTMRITQTNNPKNAIIIARSNLWPGAFAFNVQRVLDNIYFGFGFKYVTRNFSPIPLPDLDEEYPMGPEIMEINDPTVEEEEAWRLAHEAKKADGEGEGEEEGGDEEEEEEYYY